MKGTRISVRFPGDLRRRLKAAAHRNGIQESDLVRAAVQRELAAQDNIPTAYDLAKKAGLVGIVRQVDILKYLAEAFPEELLNLPPRPHQRRKEPEGA